MIGGCRKSPGHRDLRHPIDLTSPHCSAALDGQNQVVTSARPRAITCCGDNSIMAILSAIFVDESTKLVFIDVCLIVSTSNGQLTTAAEGRFTYCTYLLACPIFSRVQFFPHASDDAPKDVWDKINSSNSGVS